MRKLNAGVIGAGVFGGHHARKYAADPRTDLVALYDIDGARAAALAGELGVRAATSLEDFLSAVDVVTIASIPVTHAAAARAALEAGKHVLVEKPLATNAQEGAELVRLAAEKKLVLACGHQERLVFEAMGLFAAPEKPRAIECVRAGPWTGRSADVSVTLDLMVHDLDLALQLMGAAPVRVSARGRAVHGAPADEMTALLTFPDGRSAKLTATRVAEARTRTIRIAYPAGEARVDFIARGFENETGFPLDAGFTETPAGRDPLGANVARFVDAVTGAAPGPAVNGADAQAVLELALRIDRAAGLSSSSNAEGEHASVH
ncbi:MAG: Gfo/Idh/MocA family protein [Hyphomonadaceae bacterium]